MLAGQRAAWYAGCEVLGRGEFMRIREGLPMDYIRITDDNIEKEHICCAMSGKQGVIKKE